MQHNGKHIMHTHQSAYREELLNTLTHGLGAVLSILGLALLLLLTSGMNDGWRTLSVIVYGSSLILLYLASTCYHGSRTPHHKTLFKTLDHCAIYLLIAGSYTPFLLVTMRESLGWPMFALIWSLAALGITLKLVFRNRLKFLRVMTYLVMGWLVVFASAELQRQLPEGGIHLLVAGGLTYTAGVVFYVAHRIPYHHAIWHLFVLGGSVCHYLAIYHYVLPA